MLPENEKNFDSRIRVAKSFLDDALRYFHEGDYDTALVALTHVGGVSVSYLVYIVEEDRAGRIAKEFSDWFNENSKSLINREMQYRR